MKFINSKIVPAGANAFWNPLPEEWHRINPVTLLVLTAPYEAGSAEANTLGKMVQACGLGAEAYHIHTLQEGEDISWASIQALVQPRVVLLLGIAPERLGISALFRLHQRNSFGGCTIIPSLSLDQLIAHEAVRKELWTDGLRPCFTK